MPEPISSKKAEKVIRQCLHEEGYELSPVRGWGETGVDIIAVKDGKKFYIEVIGYKRAGPTRAKDFFESFFRTISRLKDGANNLVMAMPDLHENGLPARARNYGPAWERLGDAFPEMEIWLIKCEEPYSYSKHSWKEWLR